MSTPSMFNGDEQQIRAVFDLCQPNKDGLISLRMFRQLYEEHTNGPEGKSRSSDPHVSYASLILENC